MAEPFLHLGDIGLIIKRVGGGRCAQRMNAEAFHLGGETCLATVFLHDIVVDRVWIQRAIERASAVICNRTEHGGGGIGAWPASATYSSISCCAVTCMGMKRILLRLPCTRKCITPRRLCRSRSRRRHSSSQRMP